jgi:replicative DNA helicase
MPIKKWKDSVKEAVKEIAEFQKGNKKPYITCFNHLNENSLGGIFPGDVITIGGMSGHGKTYFLQRVEESILELNDCSNLAILRFNIEMSVKKLFLRSVKNATKKKMSEIILNQPEGEFRKAYEDVYKAHRRNDNIFHVEETITPDKFYDYCVEFLEGEGKTKTCIITIDHIALVEGKDNKKAVDETVRYINKLKLEYPNVTFIILTQLNREIEGRSNPAEMAPRPGDLYQSSTMMHLSDIVIVVHNPYMMGHKKYLALYRDKVGYLSEFFHDETSDTSSYVNLRTANAVYYHYVKLRTPDDDDFRTVFGETIGQAPIKKVKVPIINDF